MLINHTHERLTALGLAGMAKAFDDQQRQPDVTALTFEQRLGLMIDREATERENKRLVVRLKFASLRQAAIIEDVRTRFARVPALPWTLPPGCLCDIAHSVRGRRYSPRVLARLRQRRQHRDGTGLFYSRPSA
jgi:hypothetical protein